MDLEIILDIEERIEYHVDKQIEEIMREVWEDEEKRTSKDYLGVEEEE